MDAINVIQQFMKAWNDHDSEKISSLFSEDGQYIDAFTGRVTPQNEIKEMSNQIFVNFPDVIFKTIREYTNHDGAIVEYIMEGTQTGPWMADQMPLNKKVEVPGVDAAIIEKGKITKLRSYFNMKVMLKQLGYTFGPPVLNNLIES